MKTYNLYKILTVDENGIFYSPFKNFRYGTRAEIEGKLFSTTCSNSENDCGEGFYATEISGLIYTNLAPKSGRRTVVWEVEMSGFNKKLSDFKWRFENQKFIRELPGEELKVLVKTYSDSIDWDYYSLLFPISPLTDFPELNKVGSEEINLLKTWVSVRDSVRIPAGISTYASIWDSVETHVWASVRDSVRYSVRNYVWNSMWNSVGYSMRNSVLDSVRDSMGASILDPIGFFVGASIRDSIGAFVSQSFPKINNWKYIDHEGGNKSLSASM